MDFGKLSSIEGVNFALPADHPDTATLLDKLPNEENSPTVHLACPVWSDKGFVRKIYPEKTKPADYLQHYARHFGCIELNTTWYGVNTDHFEKWRRAVPEGFLFCPKVPQRISHYAQLRHAIGHTHDFLDKLTALGDHLGPIWMLLPPTFGPDRLSVLEDYLADLPTGISLSIEFRHPEWFEDAATASQLFNVLEKYRVSPIMTDVAGRRDVLHMRLTTDQAIIRFVGNRHHPSDYTRLDAWALRLSDWIRRGLNQIYFFLHQPEEHLNVELAIHLAKRLEEQGIKVGKIPSPLPPPPEQTSLF